MDPLVRLLLALFASFLLGAAVFVWGARKEAELPKVLSEEFIAKGSSVVLRKLRQKGEATFEEMLPWVDGLTVGPIWSTRRLKVTAPQKALEAILSYLTEKGAVEEVRRSGRTFYRIKVE
ncbi:hypothetical protein HPY42_00010 [Coprothermobacteraceae bacterium]|nr:hypothetical protein [Coprothermobacteraceae bacterium]